MVARQAGKVTAEFAVNLKRALGGELPALAGPAPDRAVPAAAAGRPAVAVVEAASDRWGKAAVVLSGVSVALSVIILIRQRRGQ